MDKLTVVHTVNSIHARDGGPARSVTALCSALAGHSVGLTLVTVQDQDAEGHILPDENVSVRFHPPGLHNGYQARAGALRAEGTPRVLHDHGVWLPANVSSALAAIRSQTPLVISTRGMLEPWAISYRAWKKKAAWVVYQRRVLRSAAVLHATSAAELESIRATGLKNPVAVIPNGVTLPANVVTRSESPASGKTVLFLSRVHPKKGLPMLLEAWRRIRPTGWTLVIAGPDEEGHTNELKAMADRYGIRNDLRFVGPVNDVDKWRLYAEADLFVLPTHSENFGIVIAEAMGAGLPVITTKGAPWAVLDHLGCGWWTDIKVEAIAHALGEAVVMDRESLYRIGKSGHEYVRSSLSWAAIGGQMKSVYDWVLRGGSLPSCITKS